MNWLFDVDFMVDFSMQVLLVFCMVHFGSRIASPVFAWYYGMCDEDVYLLWYHSREFQTVCYIAGACYIIPAIMMIVLMLHSCAMTCAFFQ